MVTKVNPEDKIGKKCTVCNGATILIVDDDANNIKSAKFIIQKIKPEIELDAAYSGEDALKKAVANFEKSCCSTYYKLIITDIFMGNMDGFKTAKLINKKLKNKKFKVYIVAITAQSLESKYVVSQQKLCGVEKVYEKNTISNSKDQFKEILRQYYLPS